MARRRAAASTTTLASPPDRRRKKRSRPTPRWLQRSKEIDAVRLRPHPYEFYLYFDI